MSLPKRLPLARLPTPVQKLEQLSRQLGKAIYIWRDDYTGFLESGNKVRKLEYFLAEALDQKCDWLVTCGGPQSNHTRATTVLARHLGLGVTIVSAPPATFDPQKSATGNLLLNKIFGARLKWLTQEEFQAAGASYDSFLDAEALALQREGKRPYVIPLGGSNALGVMGYRLGVQEMLPAWNAINTEPPDSVFCAFGSGGTFVGIQFGLQEQGLLKTQLFGVNVIGPFATAEKYRTRVTLDTQKKYQVTLDPARAHLVDGYVGAGYALASEADLKFYADLAQSEGVLLDPCYTGKAFQAMVSEIKKDPVRFGERILFLHSGGQFGLFAYHEQFSAVIDAAPVQK